MLERLPASLWNTWKNEEKSVNRTGDIVLASPWDLQFEERGAIAVAGRREQLETLTVTNNFFLGQGMIPVGLDVDGRGSEKGEVKEDERALTEAVELGRRMVELIRQNMRSK